MYGLRAVWLGEDVGVATIEGLVVGVAGALVLGVGVAKALIGLCEIDLDVSEVSKGI
jgi:uncharacterized membrane protein YczE